MIEINKYDKYPVDDDFFKELRTNYYDNKHKELPDQDGIIDTSQRDGMIRPNEIKQLESRSYQINPGEFLPRETGYNGNLEVSGASIFNRGKNNGDGKIDIGETLGSIMKAYEIIEPQYNIDSFDPKTQELIRSLTVAKLNHDQPQGSSIRLFNPDNYCESGPMFTTLIDHAPMAFKIPLKLYISLIGIARGKIDDLFSISIGNMFKEPDYKADESSHQYRK